ncbi:MAG: MarR family transcriptional regulator [Chloroflexi bacterium HGW-Chloroflexi-10]|nr:MAG: MarR family transcriptional regulator [Chloroflexi bacterium HGW-Chloroflexi-10]
MEQGNKNQEIGQEVGRELSTRMVMFHQAVAERFGLTSTEHKCLDLLYRNGSMMAGQLAELAGLTTGAITKIADRLEKAGFVVRERSEKDRRQVILHADPERAKEIGEIFITLSQAMYAVTSRYTEEERRVIHKYLMEMTAILKEETRILQRKQ